MTSTKTTIEEYKASFALRGTTINAWAKKHGFVPQSAYDALKGSRTGPTARTIREKANSYIKNNQPLHQAS